MLKGMTIVQHNEAVILLKKNWGKKGTGKTVSLELILTLPSTGKTTFYADKISTIWKLIVTLLWIKTNNRGLSSNANAERPPCWGSVFGVRHLHEVNMAVGGAEIHAAEGMWLQHSLFEGWAHLCFQLICKLREIKQARATSFAKMMMQYRQCFYLPAPYSRII